MSELITFTPEGTPAGYDMFSRIEVTEDNEKIKRVNGILELGDGENKIERKVQLPDLGEIWGVESSDWANYQADPAGWERDQKVNLLTQRVELLESQLASLLARNSELEEQLAQRDISASSSIIEPEPEVVIEPIPAEPDPETESTTVIEEFVTEPEPVPEAVPAVVETESTTVEQTTSERNTRRRGGRGAIGAAVLAAIGIGIGAYSLHEIEELENHQSTVDHIQPNHHHSDMHKADMDHDTYTQTSGGGSHLEFYNPAAGTHSMGVELSKKLRLQKSNGKYSFVNGQGNVVIGRIGWDRQGNLDQSTKSKLRNSGYRLSQDVLSYVTKAGKSVQHYLTDVK